MVYKIIFAAGGTGGHLFPAQGLAEQLLASKPGTDLLFAGAKLSENAYFDKTRFAYQDIVSMTPFGKNIFRVTGVLLKGIVQSFSLLSKKKPDLVIGFGSFHSFPILCAAVIKRVPLVLFESNSIPGKVIRFFAKRAVVTATYFEETKHHLKGNVLEVEIPLRSPELKTIMPQEDARKLLGLEADLATLLVFGGSQGARQINAHVLACLPLLKAEIAFQLIHFTGNEETASQIRTACALLQIPCYVKPFEPKMQIAWSAADLVICRSGAMTVSEILYYAVPAILIPYPYAADRHQSKNAQFLEQKVGGGICIEEKDVNPALISHTVQHLQKTTMKQAIQKYRREQKKQELHHVIINILENK
jgi:UDP-N-acetylglucosamine--N-acetylmuramyl-(pentapeptide) pyrophosphoryl-undecaprenol N-acetylglucosamine transferase